MKILVSAAEASSDAHGAELLKALQRILDAEPKASGETLRAFGIGGPKLREAGLEIVFDAKELLAMGTSEVLGRLPKILRALKVLEERAIAERPDVAVVIDYPDFHFRLARKLRAQKIPVIYYIPPKVWVWRKRRARFLRENFDRVLCIFPFEKDFFAKLGVNVTYVGNPLLDELPIGRSKGEARARLGLGQEDRVLAILPGSRPSELKNHLWVTLEAAALAAEKLRREGQLKESSRLKVCVPLPQTADLAEIRGQIDGWRSQRVEMGVDVLLSQGNSADVLIAADAGLIKSGTSTLEAALLGCPHVILYRPSALSSRVFKNLIRYKGPVGLTNLVAGVQAGDRYLVPEILMENVTAARLADEVYPLFTDSTRKQEMADSLQRLRRMLQGAEVEATSAGPQGGGANSLDELKSPSIRAAKSVLELARSLKTRPASP